MIEHIYPADSMNLTPLVEGETPPMLPLWTKVEHWISVDDYMPAISEIIAVTDGNHVCDSFICEREDGTDYFCDLSRDMTVTHWAPLPGSALSLQFFINTTKV